MKTIKFAAVFTLMWFSAGFAYAYSLDDYFNDSLDSLVIKTRKIARMIASEDSASDLPFFSAFTASGAGTFGACSTTPPTGTKGEVLTTTRATNATCSPLGMTATGIADNSLVVLTANQPRVEADSDGILGLRIERAATNLLLRFIEIFNAAWSDVGTPDNNGNDAAPYASGFLAVAMEDNDAVNYEGRSQTITVVSGQPHTAHCYVKAGTLNSVTIRLDGTVATLTSLSSVTYSIITVTDVSSSSTNILFEILNGDDPSLTGEVIWGGCQVEAGTYRTSIIPTTSTTVTRNVDFNKFAIFAGGAASTGSISVYTDIPTAISDTGWAALEGTTGFQLIGFGAGAVRFHATSFLAAATGPTLGLSKRSAGGDGTASFACSNVTCPTGAAITTTGVPTFFWVGDYNVGFPGSRVAPGIYTRLCWDTSTTRCR